jgi:hypothetical protein
MKDACGKFVLCNETVAALLLLQQHKQLLHSAAIYTLLFKVYLSATVYDAHKSQAMYLCLTRS